LDRRRAIVGISWIAAALVFTEVSAQQGKIWRIAFLAARSRSTPSNPDPYYDAFVDGLRDLGYIDGKNIRIEWRYAEGRYDRLPALASEFVKTNPDVIVTQSAPGALAAKRATVTIPIVFASVANPVETGVATSLSRPGGNITGISMMASDTSGKQIELLKTLLPSLARVAILRNPLSTSQSVIQNSAQAAAQKINALVVPIEVRRPEDLERAFAGMKPQGIEAVIVPLDSMFLQNRRQISKLALQNRTPVIAAYREYVEAGSLMSYGPNLSGHYRYAAVYIDKILKGAKPGDLPIEQPATLELAINLKTAKALGLTIPKELLLRADEVIE
jgi:putative ABC transport system substrate-binding protein